MAQAKVIVLNGDTFDFRWSTMGSEEETIEAALRWLKNLAAEYSHADLHFIVGNHDCLQAFVERLDDLAEELPRFFWHEHYLRLGHALFLHGDCTHSPMDATGLASYRSVWKHDTQRHPFLGHCYRISDRIGLTWLAHRSHFTRAKAIQRLMLYLDDACPGWREQTRDCYFGHTHIPFQRFATEGIDFHNTGSAIAGSPFAPLHFLIHSED